MICVLAQRCCCSLSRHWRWSAMRALSRHGSRGPCRSRWAHLRPCRRCPPRPSIRRSTIGGKELKARQIETRLSVAVQVNGRGPYHFVVDSGADTSVVGLRIAQRQQLPLGSPVILNGMTGSDQVDQVKVESLTLGPSIVRQLELPVLREDDLGGDGLIGIDALARQRLMLDFERRLITVEDARRPMKALPGEIVIVARSRRGQLLLPRSEPTGSPCSQ